ncbi:MAG: lysophospholipid acyltransferase family protein [Candidatus Saccharimonadales bacterium]
MQTPFPGIIHTVFQVSSAWFLYRIMRLVGFLRITVETPLEIDPKRHYLFVSNHQSYLDAYAIFMGLPVQTIYRSCPLRYMTAAPIYFSLLMPLIWLGGGFPTRRRRRDYHAVDYAISRLDMGERVVIFPEGKRSVRGAVAPHSGVQRIINGVTTPVEVILVHLDWSRTSWWRRTLRVNYRTHTGSSDPAEIMSSIYQL